MINAKSNIQVVVKLTTEQLQAVADTDKLLRTCATSVLFLMKVRIHQDGKDAADAPIGRYSPEYMRTRIKVGRTNDTNVVGSLTRQMENDMKVVSLGKSYGIGYSNPLNFKKSQWFETRYRRPAGIFRVSPNEQQTIITIVNKHVSDAFSQ